MATDSVNRTLLEPLMRAFPKVRSVVACVPSANVTTQASVDADGTQRPHSHDRHWPIGHTTGMMTVSVIRLQPRQPEPTYSPDPE